jgi:hypothetical protein
VGDESGGVFRAVLTHALDAKRLQMVHQMVPAASTIGALFNPKNADAGHQLPDLETAARTLGQNIRVLDASTKSEINAAFKRLAELRADALIVSSDARLSQRTERANRRSGIGIFDSCHCGAARVRSLRPSPELAAVPKERGNVPPPHHSRIAVLSGLCKLGTPQ